jgi:hypothetical protein
VARSPCDSLVQLMHVPERMYFFLSRFLFLPVQVVVFAAAGVESRFGIRGRESVELVFATLCRICVQLKAKSDLEKILDVRLPLWISDYPKMSFFPENSAMHNVESNACSNACS